MNCDVLLKGGRIVDPGHGVDDLMDLAIMGGQVWEVAPDLEVDRFSAVYDVSGLVVIPGIIDLHVHTSRRHGGQNAHRMMARAGVVTAVDLGGPIDQVLEFCQTASAGLSLAVLQQVVPGVTVSDQGPSLSEVQIVLAEAMEKGALGLKILGGHYPLTPEASRRVLETCNQTGSYVAFHSGTTETPGNLEGFLDSLEIAGDMSVHIPHVNSYFRGSEERILAEIERGLAALRGRDNIFSESHLAAINGTSARCTFGLPESLVTRRCLQAGGFEPSQRGFEMALLAGYAHVSVDRGGENVVVTGREGLEAWHRNETNLSAHFLANSPASRLQCAIAQDETGRFVVDAIATDGGGHPRNFALERGLSLVRAEAMTMSHLVHKISYMPARILGLSQKGHLGKGADGDVTVADPDRCLPVMSLGRGKLIMYGGAVVGRGTTIITTEVGAKSVKDLGLNPYIVDLAESLFFQGRE